MLTKSKNYLWQENMLLSFPERSGFGPKSDHCSPETSVKKTCYFHFRRDQVLMKTLFFVIRCVLFHPRTRDGPQRCSVLAGAPEIFLWVNVHARPKEDNRPMWNRLFELRAPDFCFKKWKLNFLTLWQKCVYFYLYRRSLHTGTLAFWEISLQEILNPKKCSQRGITWGYLSRTRRTVRGTGLRRFWKRSLLLRGGTLSITHDNVLGIPAPFGRLKAGNANSGFR